jgi:hypothetical protein
MGMPGHGFFASSSDQVRATELMPAVDRSPPKQPAFVTDNAAPYIMARNET